MFEQTFKNIDDVLRKEAGCTTELDYTEQTSWILFLKYLDELEEDRKIELNCIAHTRHPLKREKRANTHGAGILSGRDAKSQAFLDFVLTQYVAQGEDELGMDKLPDLLDLKYGSPSDAVRELGSVSEIRSTLRGFQRQLYDAGEDGSQL